MPNGMVKIAKKQRKFKTATIIEKTRTILKKNRFVDVVI